MIELRSATKTYKMGDEVIHALDGVNLAIKDGDFVSIIGPSGSGKSTLANVVGGLDTLDSGDVLIDGQSIAKLSDTALSHYRNKKIGFVFQQFNLQSNYTALENVMLPLLFADMPNKERLAKATECLRAVGLEDRLHHRPTQLSGGQQQRVSIARALANDPSIILADEPTGNLDSKKSEEIMDLLEKLNKEKGITLIVITHDMNVAKRAKLTITIKDGRMS